MCVGEPLRLSTQSVISLSVKTLLNNVDFKLFLLNSAGFLSKFRHAEFLMLELAFLCLSTQSVIFLRLKTGLLVLLLRVIRLFV